MYYNISCENSIHYIKDNSVDAFFCDPPYFISGNKSKKINLENGNYIVFDINETCIEMLKERLKNE